MSKCWYFEYPYSEEQTQKMTEKSGKSRKQIEEEYFQHMAETTARVLECSKTEGISFQKYIEKLNEGLCDEVRPIRRI